MIYAPRTISARGCFGGEERENKKKEKQRAGTYLQVKTSTTSNQLRINWGFYIETKKFNFNVRQDYKY